MVNKLPESEMSIGDVRRLGAESLKKVAKIKKEIAQGSELEESLVRAREAVGVKTELTQEERHEERNNLLLEIERFKSIRAKLSETMQLADELPELKAMVVKAKLRNLSLDCSEAIAASKIALRSIDKQIAETDEKQEKVWTQKN